MRWVRTFDFAASSDEVWAALATTHPDFVGNHVAGGADHSVTWTDLDDDIGIEMSMRLTVTESETGARVTITRSGFGEGDMFEVRQTSKLLSWRETMHDLAVYLETGLDVRRPYAPHPEHPISATGVEAREVLGGLRVTRTQPGSFGEAAGLEAGDLVIRLAGLPVYDRSDLWLLQRGTAPGATVDVEFVRAGALQQASAAMSPIDLWATGELGGGPRE